jgi:hypothetical protein
MAIKRCPPLASLNIGWTAGPRRPIVLPASPFTPIALKRGADHHTEESAMLRTILAVVLAGGLVATLPPSSAFAAAKKEDSAKPSGQTAAHERQVKCGAEWKAAKAAGKIEKGQTWPKYWSACNKRLKGQSA